MSAERTSTCCGRQGQQDWEKHPWVMRNGQNMHVSVTKYRGYTARLLAGHARPCNKNWRVRACLGEHAGVYATTGSRLPSSAACRVVAVANGERTVRALPCLVASYVYGIRRGWMATDLQVSPPAQSVGLWSLQPATFRHEQTLCPPGLRLPSQLLACLLLTVRPLLAGPELVLMFQLHTPGIVTTITTDSTVSSFFLPPNTFTVPLLPLEREPHLNLCQQSYICVPSTTFIFVRTLKRILLRHCAYTIGVSMLPGTRH